MVMLTVVSGCHGLQYCSSMVIPLDLNARQASVLIGLSLTVAHLFQLIAMYLVNFFTSQVRLLVLYMINYSVPRWD